MSYMALYRKWRPGEFQEVKGQEHIVTTLKNQITHDRIGHAYLFCGTRGTGKTTMAKLMAKAVNCEHVVDGSPCNQCDSCKAITMGNSMNVIEIDAASNNGVENIRQINNAVQYTPQSGKYLVYIIDEVHMLSVGAFNALLKTLEEPPAYVIFILATTELHKIPVTILSRCQRYDFRRITVETITDRLEELLGREQVKATKEALTYIAKAADGSMRDALSILDQCISFNLGEELTYDRVLETIGAVDIDVYMELLTAISEKNAITAIDIVDRSIWQGKDLTQFINEFTAFIRNVLMLKLDPDMMVDITSHNRGRIIELGNAFQEATLMEYVNILQEAASKISYATTKRIVLEVAVIKMARPQMRQDYSALEERINQLEQELSEAKSQPQQVVYVTNDGTNPENTQGMQYKEMGAEEGDNHEDKASAEVIVANLKSRYKEAELEELKEICNCWNYIKDNSIKLTRTFMEKAKLRPGNAPATLDLILIKDEESKQAIDYYEKRDNVDKLETKIAQIAERKVHINVCKISSKEAVEQRVNEWDLSKINAEIDFK